MLPTWSGSDRTDRAPWTVRVRPTYIAPTALATDPAPAFKLLRGDIAYAQVSAFALGMALELSGDLELMGQRATLRGLVVDLRGNGGGSPAAVADLHGAFVHPAWAGPNGPGARATRSYDCTVEGQCRLLNHR